MDYDMELFNRFAALAVKEEADLVVGETYYSNRGEEFVLLQLGSYEEMRKEENERFNENLQTSSKEFPELNSTRWMLIQTDYNKGWVSLSDNNIGGSYNPWLIFSHKCLAEACKEMLVVSFDKPE